MKAAHHPRPGKNYLSNQGIIKLLLLRGLIDKHLPPLV